MPKIRANIKSGKSDSALIYLVRHGHSTANSKNVLAGRDNTVGLTSRGNSEAQELADSLADIDFHSIYSSPLLRCQQTIAPLLRSRPKQKVVYSDSLLEMDYGSWSGSKLSTLSKRPLWKAIQNSPSQVRFPDGESFLEMSSRITSALFDFSIPGKSILICTHGDVIKAALTSIMGSHIDNLQRVSIDPASVSLISLGPNQRIIRMNDVSHLKMKSLKSDGPTLGGGSGGKKR